MPSQNRSRCPSARDVGGRVGLGHHAGGQPAHHGHRDRGQLALDQIRRGGDLVGDRDLGDHQFVAVAVDGAGIAVQNRDAAAPIATSVWPLRHARPMVSVMTTPTVTPRRSRMPRRRGTPVGIDGQQSQFVSADVGPVHAGRGLNHAQARSR